MLRILKPLTVFIVGGFAYGLIEVLSRGFTHISMGVLGGAAMCLIHRLNSGRRSVPRIAVRTLLSAAFITVLELITGELLNVRLGMHIWDYSSLPFNLDGQICVLFSLKLFCHAERKFGEQPRLTSRKDERQPGPLEQPESI